MNLWNVRCHFILWACRTVASIPVRLILNIVQMFERSCLLWSGAWRSWSSAHEEVLSIDCGDMRFSSTPLRQPAEHHTAIAGAGLLVDCCHDGAPRADKLWVPVSSWVNENPLLIIINVAAGRMCLTRLIPPHPNAQETKVEQLWTQAQCVCGCVWGGCVYVCENLSQSHTCC